MKYAMLQIKSDESLGPRGLERTLLTNIVRELARKGIPSNAIKGANICLFTHCKIDHSRIVLGVMAGTRASPSTVKCSIHLGIYKPLWRKVFARVFHGGQCDEEILATASRLVTEILTADPRIQDIVWGTKEDFLSWFQGDIPEA